MTARETPIHTRRDGAVQVVEVPKDDLLSEEQIRSLSTTIGSLIDDEPRPRVVIDFTRVGIVTSELLGVLIAMHKRAIAKQGQLRLAGLVPRMTQLLRLTQLDTVLTVHETVHDATAAMG